MFNTLPYNYFPASTAKFEEGKNDVIQAEIDAIKDGTNIDSFGDVETALSLKVNSADMETALATKTNLSNIAPTFDSESGTYDIGEQVIYEGVLYEFISAHDTPGDWDSTEVQAVKISELIDTLNSNLTNKAHVPSSSDTKLGSVTAGDSNDFTATADGYIAIYCSSASSQKTFIVTVRDNAVTRYGTFLTATLPAYNSETIGGMFVKKGRTYKVRNVGENNIDVYFCS